MHILVTGGAGYIGSHTCVELLAQGHRVCVIDNLCNSKAEVLNRVEQISGKAIDFHEIDLVNGADVDRIFGTNEFDAVIHFAGLKSVAESIAEPTAYYYNNITGSINLCTAMKNSRTRNLVFSSSATVYGNSDELPLHEQLPVTTSLPTNPYGRTKVIIEELLRDLWESDHDWNLAILRYFNPVGAHSSGLIGEDPTGTPANLMPFISQVAVGKRPHLTVFGDDYDTGDGTALRDYIHVVDLAEGHIAALQRLSQDPGYVVYNLGTGRGTSVLDLIHAFERSNDVKIPFKISDRRAGDPPASYTDTSLAAEELSWTASRTIDDMCRDTWRWQKMNPNGFEQGD